MRVGLSCKGGRGRVEGEWGKGRGRVEGTHA